MNEKEWKNFIKKLNGQVYRNNQYLFYKRSFDFINSNDDIEINKGGMGLGKTLAISKLIQNNKNSFAHIFIATPTATIKNEWSKELNILKEKYSVWISKSETCIKKIKDFKFSLKNCNDDCEYRNHLESYSSDFGREYSPECIFESSNLNYPLKINDYYNKNSFKNCLLPITRCSLINNKIIVGDYFGFLFPKMHEYIVKKKTNDSLLIIDEAHLIPQRVSGLLSKSLNLNKTITEIKKEIECEYFLISHIEEYSVIQDCLNTLEKIKLELINKNEKEGRYTLINFVEDWNNFSKYPIEQFRSILLLFINEKLNINLDYEYEPEHYCSKFIKFLDNWIEKHNDENYSQHFQYFEKKDKEIQLSVKCRNPSDYLEKIWKKWDKVIMVSGTIPDYNYFKTMTGIENSIVRNEEVIFSYNIKENVIVYPKDNFTSRNRKDTYEKNNKLLIEVLKNLEKRTIIYVQSKDDSLILEEQLRDEFKTYNFSKTEDGFDVNNRLLEELKEKFSKELKAIAINHITGKVEGQNYLDEFGESVSNIIIYGFPYPKQDLYWQDKLEYYTKKLKNPSLAKQYVSFYPANNVIYQACMRAKRKEEANPIIILWGKEFAIGSPGHKFTYDELKGRILNSEEELLSLIIKKNGERNSNL